MQSLFVKEVLKAYLSRRKISDESNFTVDLELFFILRIEITIYLQRHNPAQYIRLNPKS